MANILRQPCDAGVIQGSPGSITCTPQQGVWILAATILGSSMAFIDGTVVNVALPILQESLNATTSQVQWMVEAYALFLAALILVGGSLGDHFGRRRIFALGVSVFTVASIWCGLAPNPGQLILGRALQGAGGALLVPGSLAIISASFDRHQRGQAIGTWSAFTAITTAVGPVLGGWLVETLSWRWVFFLNIPLAVITLAITLKYIPETFGDTADQKLDWWGAFFATMGLGGLVFGLVEQPNLGWGSPLVVGSILGGGVFLVLFIAVERRQANPMMPLDLFQSRMFTGANLLTFFLYGALGGAFFFLPFNLIQVQGYSPTAAGAANLPLILMLFLLSRWTGALVERFGSQRLLILGPVIAALGYGLFILPGIGGSYWITFFPPMVVLGLGMAITVAPLTTSVMGAVDTGRAGVASGVNNAISRTAGLLALAVLGIFVLNQFSQALDRQIRPLNLGVEAQAILAEERIKLAGAEVPPGLDGPTQQALEDAIDQAYLSSFRLVMGIAAGMSLVAALFAWLMLGGQRVQATLAPHPAN